MTTAASDIARALRGKTIIGGYMCCCPVPSHGRGGGDRNPSLLVKDGDRAPLFKCFAGCDARDVVAALRHRALLDDAPNQVSRRRDNLHAETAPDHVPSPEAITIWGGARAAPGTIVATYLQARGITLAPPPSLRCGCHHHLDRYELPTMVAAVQAPDRRTIAVQTTLIDPRGDRKAQVHLPRKTTGALGWGAVRLAAATHVLGLAEGTEKALAAMQLFGVPCWSSLGAGRMHRVWIPDAVSELHIFADNDDAGRAAAERTAHAHRHRSVLLRFPPDQHKDWDDVTSERSRAA